MDPNNTYGINDIQEKLLDLLKVFIKMCRDENLSYFSCGGTCLGAVRHNGFIPWDDDLDVFMLRPDYEKLWERYSDVIVNQHYKLCRTTKEKNYHHRVMQLVDLNTTFINRRCADEDIEHGIYIDIIPLDAMANSIFGRIEQSVNCILYSVYNIQTIPEFNGGKMERIMVSVLLNLVKNTNRRYKIWSKAEKRMTKYSWEKATHIIELTTAFKNLFKPHPIEWFGDSANHVFEDIIIKLPINYEDYLTQGFGDYMSLPPVEDQKPRHNLVFIDLDHSYKKYKGIYYLKRIT